MWVVQQPSSDLGTPLLWFLDHTQLHTHTHTHTYTHTFLTFICTCVANIFAAYNQQDTKFHNLFITVRCST